MMLWIERPLTYGPKGHQRQLATCSKHLTCPLMSRTFGY